jgi:protein phosphatase PTC6
VENTRRYAHFESCTRTCVDGGSCCSFGDGEFKPLGVTGEPEVKHRMINGQSHPSHLPQDDFRLMTFHPLTGDDYAYMVFVTDGVSSLISNQEIIDLARNAFDPSRAAQAIIDFAEDLGAEDNASVLVVPLAGWGNVGGVDETEARREYRKKKVSSLSTRMQRM